MASGEPIYSGVFCPGMDCSYGHADGVPIIVPERVFVSTNLTSNVRFVIQRRLPTATADAKHDPMLEDTRLAAAARKLQENRKPRPSHGT